MTEFRNGIEMDINRPEECLDKAKKIITDDRNKDYGNYTKNLKVISNFWKVFLGKDISPHEVALLMALLKIARISTGKFTPDSYIDACGYLSLAYALDKRKTKD